MKLINLLIIAILSASMALYSCGSDNSNSGNTDDATTSDAQTTDPGQTTPIDANALTDGAQPTEANPAAPSPASAGAGTVQHYICPKNCAGSGGAAAGKCPVCGSDYVHNQAFHGQAGTAPAPSTAGNTANTPPPAQTQPSAPQNAKGVWHYTCSKGCSGGAGAAGKCASCGGELAHNAAYHQ